MHPLLLEMMPFIKQGYCCSQLLMLVLLQSNGLEDTRLVRSMHGLCFGMGGGEGPCGLLSGGGAVLGLLAGHGGEHEQAHSELAPLLADYQEWFTTHTKCSGLCFQVLDYLDAKRDKDAPPDAQKCGNLLGQCWDKMCELCENYEIDMEVK